MSFPPASAITCSLHASAEGQPDAVTVLDHFLWHMLGLHAAWHWKPVDFTKGDYWDLGIEDISALRAVWAEIGAEIVAHRHGAT